MTTHYHYYSNIRGSFWYRLVLCCLITLVMMYCHRFLPAKVLDLIPSKDVKVYIYSDKNSSGQDMVSWTDFEAHAWQCDIEKNGSSHLCGANVALGDGPNTKGVDLSLYDQIRLELEYTGPDKQLRFYLRNYVEGFSDISNTETSKYENVLIPTEFMNGTFSIDFSELAVAEWWITGYKVPRAVMRPAFDHVQLLGIDLQYPSTPGLHKFHLKKLQFIGLWMSAERWYLSILIFWILVIFGMGAYNLWQLKLQNRAERQRLEVLISKNTVLESETNHYRQLSMLDQLTGVLNRHGLSEYIQNIFPDDQPHEVALIIVDVDFFKKINDTYGHDGGDKVLQTVARVIRENVRGRDTAARWGGEEFVVILPETRVEEARIAAEKLRNLVAAITFEGMPDLQVTISLGVGAISGIEPFHMLFRRVDVALYQAKAQGRNRVVVAQE